MLVKKMVTILDEEALVKLEFLLDEITGWCFYRGETLEGSDWWLEKWIIIHAMTNDLKWDSAEIARVWNNINTLLSRCE